jgi:hypothetical protein
VSANNCAGLPLLDYGEHAKPKGWKAAAPTRCERLRALLASGQWRSHAEMTAAGGARFGARLLELRRGQDGGTPLEVESRIVGDDDRRVEYRLVGEAPAYVAPPACVRPQCPACGQPVPEVTP